MFAWVYIALAVLGSEAVEKPLQQLCYPFPKSVASFGSAAACMSGCNISKSDYNCEDVSEALMSVSLCIGVCKKQYRLGTFDVLTIEIVRLQQWEIVSDICGIQNIEEAVNGTLNNEETKRIFAEIQKLSNESTTEENQEYFQGKNDLICKLVKQMEKVENDKTDVKYHALQHLLYWYMNTDSDKVTDNASDCIDHRELCLTYCDEQNAFAQMLSYNVSELK